MTAIDELDPALEGTLELVRAYLASDFDLETVHALATRAAQVDQRAGYRENGRETAWVGGEARCVALLALLLEHGVVLPRGLLRQSVRSPAVTELLLRRTEYVQSEVDAALLATCDEHSFGPHLEVVDALLSAKPTRDAIDEALRRAAAGAMRYIGVPVEDVFFDVFERLLSAGARADHGDGSRPTALHIFVRLADPNAGGAAKLQIPRRAKRGDEVLARAIASASSIDVVDANGQTPLHVATHHAIANRAAMLVAAGADRTRRDANGKTPVDLLRSRDVTVFEALGLPPPATLPITSRRQRFATARAAQAGPAAVAPSDPFPVGAIVMHPKFGEGAITATAGVGATRKLSIRFADATRTLSASFFTPKP